MGVSLQPTVLIVDDSKLSRKSIEEALKEEEYKLLFAEDGYQALQLAEETHPDLILLDIMMPGIDGFEVCRRIRESSKLEAIPLLMITSMDDRESRIKGIQAGADDFISKPFDRTLLRTRVQTITRLNRYRRLLRERSRFEWVIENAADGYVVLSQKDEIEYINSRGAELLEMGDTGELTGKSFHDVVRNAFHCEPKESWRYWPHTIIDAPNAVRFLIKPETGSHHSKWIQLTCLDVPQYPSDPIVLILKDVSTFINEQRITWSFHGMMSHKLRTPLNIIGSSIELFNEEDLNEDNRNLFRMFKDGVTRINSDLNEVLEFIDAPFKSHTLEYITIEDLRGILREVASSLNVRPPSLVNDNVEETDRLPVGKKAFRAVITELFGNSVKFHPQNTPSLTVSIKSDEDAAVLKVSDDGIHMSDQTLQKAWMPYYQGEKYFTGQLEGMGLGLSMVSTIVWEVSGSFRIRNRIGKPGVEVTLTFPMAKDPEPALP